MCTEMFLRSFRSSVGSLAVRRGQTVSNNISREQRAIKNRASLVSAAASTVARVQRDRAEPEQSRRNQKIFDALGIYRYAIDGHSSLRMHRGYQIIVHLITKAVQVQSRQSRDMNTRQIENQKPIAIFLRTFKFPQLPELFAWFTVKPIQSSPPHFLGPSIFEQCEESLEKWTCGDCVLYFRSQNSPQSTSLRTYFHIQNSMEIACLSKQQFRQYLSC